MAVSPRASIAPFPAAGVERKQLSPSVSFTRSESPTSLNVVRPFLNTNPNAETGSRRATATSSIGPPVTTVLGPGGRTQRIPSLAVSQTPTQATAAPGATAGGGEEIPETMFSWMDKMKMQKRSDAQSFLFETTLYVVFMCVFGSVTYTSFNSWNYFFVDNVRDQLLMPNFIPDKNFYGMNNAGDFFNWCGSILLPALFPQTNYTGATLSDYDRRFFNWHNYRVGRLRFRQVRMSQSKHCLVNKDFEGTIKTCLGPFETSSEEQKAYGPWNDSTNLVKSAFQWRSSGSLCNNNFGGRYCNSIMYGIAFTNYPDSGYVWDFSSDLPKAMAELEALQDARWLDFQTSAMFVDFTLYNANIQLVCGVHLMIEFFPTGALYISESIKPLPLFTLETSKNIGVLVGEIFMTLMVVLYIVRECWEFWNFFKVDRGRCSECQMAVLRKKHGPKLIKCFECGRSYNMLRLPNCPQCGMETSIVHQCWRGYFLDGWNIIDIFNQSFFLWVLAMRFTLRGDMVKVDYNVGDTFLLFYPLAYYYDFSNWINAANALMCFTKTFKYLEKFKALSVLTKTMSHAKKHLLPFVVIFSFIFVGFSLSYYLAFGADLADYRDWGNAMMSLIRVMFGDFNYQDFHYSNRVLGPFLFCIFLVLSVLILLSIFLAIVSDAFEDIQQDLLSGGDDYDTSSLKLLISAWRVKLSKLGLGFATNPLFHNIQILISNFNNCKELNIRQIDDMRAFRNEIEHNPDNVRLFSAIVKAFNGKVDKSMTVTDYNLLRDTVQKFRHSLAEEELTLARAAGFEADEDGFSGDDAATGAGSHGSGESPTKPQRHGLGANQGSHRDSYRRSSSAQYLEVGRRAHHSVGGVGGAPPPLSARGSITSARGAPPLSARGGGGDAGGGGGGGATAGSYAFQYMMPDIEARTEIMAKHVERIQRLLDNREKKILGLSTGEGQ